MLELPMLIREYNNQKNSGLHPNDIEFCCIFQVQVIFNVMCRFQLIHNDMHGFF